MQFMYWQTKFCRYDHVCKYYNLFLKKIATSSVLYTNKRKFPKINRIFRSPSRRMASFCQNSAWPCPSPKDIAINFHKQSTCSILCLHDSGMTNFSWQRRAVSARPAYANLVSNFSYNYSPYNVTPLINPFLRSKNINWAPLTWNVPTIGPW